MSIPDIPLSLDSEGRQSRLSSSMLVSSTDASSRTASNPPRPSSRNEIPTAKRLKLSSTTISAEFKPVIVTGANKGIGLAIVQRLLDETTDTFVFLGSRSLERGEAALKTVLSADTKGRASVLQIDVSDEKSIEKAVESVKAKLGSTPLYALVNNAGISPVDYMAYGDRKSLESTMKVNYYGLLNTTNAFLPLMGKGGRIVNMASILGPMYVSSCSKEVAKTITSSKVTLKDIENFYTACMKLYVNGPRAFAKSGFGTGAPYGISKAAVNALTIVLARENKDLIINSCHPGYVATDLTGNMGAVRPYEGAFCPVNLVTEKAENLGSGWFYGEDAKRNPLKGYREPGSSEYKPDAED
ncbi:hypothetical protein AAMO2058_001557100 [Amorphochlora amoebiformis]